jgi:hypothetical protein
MMCKDSRGIILCIYDLDTNGGSLTLRPLWLRGRASISNWRGDRSGPGTGLEALEKRKIFGRMPVIEMQFLARPTLTLVTLT